MDQTDKPNDEARRAEFVRLLTLHQMDIYFYVHSLAPDSNDAAEIVQNTNVVLWEKCTQFDLAREFRPWAFQIARYEVLKHRTKAKRKCLCFSESFVDELALQARDYSTIDDDFMDNARRCIAQLPSLDRDILRQRYSLQTPCDRIAEMVGRPVRWVYKSLCRIRRELLDCMTRHTNAGREP